MHKGGGKKKKKKGILLIAVVNKLLQHSPAACSGPSLSAAEVRSPSEGSFKSPMSLIWRCWTMLGMPLPHGNTASATQSQLDLERHPPWPCSSPAKINRGLAIRRIWPTASISVGPSNPKRTPHD